jgi:hypothetical protein
MWLSKEIPALLSVLVLWACSHPQPTLTPAEAPNPIAVPGSILIQSFRDGLRGVHAANPRVKLSVGDDASLGPILLVAYPGPGRDPASRDVWCDSETRNWTGGRAISFQVRASHALRLSVSFLDRNGVAYTAWTQVPAGAWQTVDLAFDAIRPNPRFQPPTAKRGAPLDLSEVTRLGFAPQDPGPGSLAVSAIVIRR